MRRKLDFNHQDAIAARNRIALMFDAVSPEHIISITKAVPSLRGIILGYLSEEMFEQHLNNIPQITNIIKPDDHDRKNNKSDRTVVFDNKTYKIQIKSIQTNSITWDIEKNVLQAYVQNDASDKRKILLPNGEEVITTCYLANEYDVLAVSLFPFSERWDFAYKRNTSCRKTNNKKHSETVRSYLLSTTEKITFPLTEEWTTDLLSLLNERL